MTRTLRRQLRTVKYIALGFAVSLAFALVIVHAINNLPEEKPVQLNDRQQAAYENMMNQRNK